MDRIIVSVGDYTMRMRIDPYLALIESIISQQLSGKAAQSIYKRFTVHFQNSSICPLDVSSLSSDKMRSFGLSEKKIEYIMLLTQGILSGKININAKWFSKMRDQEVINYLTKIKGIGVWTADMFLIFCLGRLDVFPVTDVGIKRAIKNWYFTHSGTYLSEQTMIKLAEPWKPFRSVASWYLWKSNRNMETIG